MSKSHSLSIADAKNIGKGKSRQELIPFCLLFGLGRLFLICSVSTVLYRFRRCLLSDFLQLLKEVGTLSSVVYGAMDQEARSIHLDKFRKGKV